MGRLTDSFSSTISKLIVAFITIALLFLFLGGAQFYFLVKISALDREVEHADQVVMETHALQLSIADLLMPPHDYLITGSLEERENFKVLRTETENILTRLQSLDPDSTADISLVEQDLQAICETAEALLGLRDPVGNKDVGQLMEEMDAKEQKLINDLSRFLTHASEVKQNAGLTKIRAVRAIKFWETLLLGMALILILIIAIFTRRSIGMPLLKLQAVINQVASGDLTGGSLLANTRDEFGSLARAVNQMIQNLKDIAYRLTGKARELTEQTQQISSGTEQTASAATSAASSVSKVAALAEEVSSAISNLSDAAAQTAQHARAGQEGLDKVVAQMAAIQQATRNMVAAMERLGKKSEEISTVVELITQIADQTNLLALNAAIEAARAGEQGKGFAVVAEEVRRLAEQSASAAKKIFGLIEAVQEEAKTMSAMMDQNDRTVSEETVLTSEVARNFREIIQAVEDLNGQFKEIARATQEAAGGVSNIATAAQQQTATMQEMASSTQQLAAMAEELKGLARRFKVA